MLTLSLIRCINQLYDIGSGKSVMLLPVLTKFWSLSESDVHLCSFLFIKSVKIWVTLYSFSLMLFKYKTMIIFFLFLALASRCLQLIVHFIPKVRQHFEDRLISKNKQMMKHLDQANKVFLIECFDIPRTYCLSPLNYTYFST